MDQINKALLNQLTQKIGVMRGMQMSDEEIEKSFDKSELDLIESVKIEKGKSFPVGTVHNGFKKVAEGKWQKVSKHGLTKKEHKVYLDQAEETYKQTGRDFKDYMKKKKTFEGLDDKEYSDEEVHGKEQSEKKEDKKPELDLGAKKLMSLISVFSNKYNDITKVSVYGTPKGNWAVLYDGKEIGTIGGNQLSDETVQKYNLEEIDVDEEKSLNIDIEKSEDSKEKKVAKVMAEFKAGTLKSSSGEAVTDQKQAIAIAMSEAGIKKEKSIESDIEKAEGERGGKIIGHTKSGKPIYEGGEHHKIIQSSFNLSPEHHLKTAESLRSQAKKLKSDLASGKYGQGATANSKLRELERRAKVHEDVYHIKKSNQ